MDRIYTEGDIEAVAQEVIAALPTATQQATVLALQGDLGAGKTTLTKTLAKQLGVQETVVSPTFVIAKFYPASEKGFETLVHIDAYRIESLDELGPIGWQQLLQQPNILVVVEWPEKITEALPADRTHFNITHEGDQRRIIQLI